MLANIVESRLIEEHVLVNADVLRRLANAQDKAVSAESNITNTLSGVAKDSAPEQVALVVDANLTISLKVRSIDEVVLEYQSKYRCAFKVLKGDIDAFHGGGIDGTIPEELIPHIATTNWIATRRADGSIAATGIANMRLNVPDIAIGVKLASAVEADESVREISLESPPRPRAIKVAAKAKPKPRVR